MITTTIKQQCEHRSIRNFTNEPVSKLQCDAIIAAASSTSSSCFLQCSSIIRITDPELRRQLSSCASNQKCITEAAEFWVFCADFQRHKQIKPDVKLGFIELLLVGSVDTAMMAQNALTAAESMGLGGVYIGGLRNNIDTVTHLLKLPQHVLPLFGLCIGHPAQIPELKPRLPASLLVHENSYQPLDRTMLAAYDAHIALYYQQRTDNKRQDSWSEQIERTLSKERRPFMLDYLNKQGWATR